MCSNVTIVVYGKSIGRLQPEDNVAHVWRYSIRRRIIFANIYILKTFYENPYSNYKYTMVLYNLFGRRRRYDVNNAIPLLEENCE